VVLVEQQIVALVEAGERVHFEASMDLHSKACDFPKGAVSKMDRLASFEMALESSDREFLPSPMTIAAIDNTYDLSNQPLKERKSLPDDLFDQS